MKNGSRVRILADNREGFVVGHTLDGLAIHTTEGRVVHAKPAEVERIPTPAGPEPVLPTPRRPQSADHPLVVKTGGLSLMQDGKWQ